MMRIIRPSLCIKGSPQESLYAQSAIALEGKTAEIAKALRELLRDYPRTYSHAVSQRLKAYNQPKLQEQYLHTIQKLAST